MESGPERDDRMEGVPAPEAERNPEEPPADLVPSAGTLELQPEGDTEAPTSTRHTEILELPKVDRRAPATPTVRPGGGSTTPATGKSRAERKQEKKTARKDEKTARKEEKRNRRAKQAEQAEEREGKPEETPSRTPVRRKLDAAMESAGTIESVLLPEKEYKALQRDPSHKPNFYFSIDRLISNLRHIPRTVYGPPAGEEERIKLMELRREEEAEEAEAAQCAAEEADEGSASRKRKLEELEEKKRVLEEENDRKRKELEEESRRLKAVEEAERRAREQRSRNPRVQVPVASEKEKQENWFERKATELVENYIQSYGPQQKKAKEAAEMYSRTCEDSKQAQEDFISALQKTQEKAENLQKCLGRALEAAVAFGREEERAQQCTQAKERCTRPEPPRVKARPQIPAGLQERIRKERAQKEGSSTPGKKEVPEVPTPAKPALSLGVHARKQPAEEEPGKEWRERVSSDVWKVGRQLKEGEQYLECKYPPFTKEWQEGLREELLSLANRGFAQGEDEQLYPTKKFGWQLRSSREFESINQSLEQAYGVRLVWKARKSKEKVNQSTTSIVFQLEEERWTKFRSSGSSTRYWGHYPRITVCAQFVGLRATGKLDVPSRTWSSNYGNRLWQCWFRLIDCASTTLAGISYANCTSMTRTTTSSTTTQQLHWWTTVQSTTGFPKLTRGGIEQKKQRTRRRILKSNLQKMNVKNARCPRSRQWSMLHRRKQQSLRIQSRGWPCIRKHSWKCRIRPSKAARKGK